METKYLLVKAIPLNNKKESEPLMLCNIDKLATYINAIKSLQFDLLLDLVYYDIYRVEKNGRLTHIPNDNKNYFTSDLPFGTILEIEKDTTIPNEKKDSFYYELVKELFEEN